LELGLLQNYSPKPVKKAKFDFYGVDKFAPNDVFLLEWQHYWHTRAQKLDKLSILQQYTIEERKKIGKETIPKVGDGFMIDCDFWHMQSKKWQQFNPELCNIPMKRWRFKFFEVVKVKHKRSSLFCTVRWKITILEEM
jgi:hypothetical protein